MAPRAIVIGSANTETVLLVSQDFSAGAKLTYRVGMEDIGGSAINWSRWLNAAGLSLEVYCPIGGDDGGRRIDELMAGLKVTPNGGIVPFEDPSDRNTTPHSYVLVYNGTRTILSSQSPTRRHLDNIEASLRVLTKDKHVHVAMIGNVPTDETGPTDTRAILGALPTNVFVYANGRVQFRHGRDQWGGSLDRINCLQFAMREAKAFASVLKGGACCSIREAIDTFLENRLNVIVTLGRLGAISIFGQLPKLRDSLFLTWPAKPAPPASLFPERELPEVLDPTGAGDAFGAGFVASLASDLVRDDQHLHRASEETLKATFVRALDTAALLASWACWALGGRSICPAEHASIVPWIGRETSATSIRPVDTATNLLYALDR